MFNTVAASVFMIGLVSGQIQQSRFPETNYLVHSTAFCHGNSAFFCSQQFDLLRKTIVHIHGTTIHFLGWIIALPFMSPFGNIIIWTVRVCAHHKFQTVCAIQNSFTWRKILDCTTFFFHTLGTAYQCNTLGHHSDRNAITFDLHCSKVF